VGNLLISGLVYDLKGGASRNAAIPGARTPFTLRKKVPDSPFG